MLRAIHMDQRQEFDFAPGVPVLRVKDDVRRLIVCRRQVVFRQPILCPNHSQPGRPERFPALLLQQVLQEYWWRAAEAPSASGAEYVRSVVDVLTHGVLPPRLTRARRADRLSVGTGSGRPLSKPS